MVVADQNVESIAVLEPKADSPLIVDRYRILPLSIALSRAARSTYSSFRAARRATSSGNLFALPVSYRSLVRWSAKVFIKAQNVTCHVTDVNW